MAAVVRRSRPNILITGTPGTGKTTLCERLATLTGFTHLNVTEIAKSKGYVEEYDAELDTFVLDEDKVWVFFFSFWPSSFQLTLSGMR